MHGTKFAASRKSTDGKVLLAESGDGAVPELTYMNHRQAILCYSLAPAKHQPAVPGLRVTQ
jgi:hypothetical protein